MCGWWRWQNDECVDDIDGRKASFRRRWWKWENDECLDGENGKKNEQYDGDDVSMMNGEMVEMGR